MKSYKATMEFFIIGSRKAKRIIKGFDKQKKIFGEKVLLMSIKAEILPDLPIPKKAK